MFVPEFTAAVIGVGDDPDPNNPSQAGLGYSHATGYAEARDVELVTCADVVHENAEAFAKTWGLGADSAYVDSETMLTEVEPDIVSVCTPPKMHADVVIAAAQTRVPAAIHCEKPMADTWGAARRMVDVCKQNNVKLTFGHQRRFGGPARTAKRLLFEDQIGDLERIEMSGANLYDWGSHLFDLANYFNDERAVKWVLGQVDYRDARQLFGVYNENQGLVLWKWENDVCGVASTGDGQVFLDTDQPGHRLVGTDGTIEFGLNKIPLRIRRAGDKEWTDVDTEGEGFHATGKHAGEYGNAYMDRAIQDVVNAVRDGYTSELCAENALRATEIIFGTYESSRRRGRVEFPLDVDDNPLESMLESG